MSLTDPLEVFRLLLLLSRFRLCPLTSLGLLVLPQRPLVALHDHSTVLTDRCWHFFDPVVRLLPHQFSACRLYSSAALVATKSRRSGHESCLQVLEQEVLTPKVLAFGRVGGNFVLRVTSLSG